MKTLIWFRRDLRLADNPALSAALAGGQPVEAIYVHDADAHAVWPIGGASRWYLHQSLLNLQKSLATINVRIRFLSGSATRQIPAVARETGASRVVWNRVVEPGQENMDEQIRSVLSTAGISVKIYADDCLLMPESALKKDGGPYRVFTPFWRQVEERLGVAGVQSRLHPRPAAVAQTFDCDPAEVERLKLLDRHPWHLKLDKYWQPGEVSAHRLLETFLDSKIAAYQEQREIPASAGTSQLSPALHFGEISAAGVYSLCQEALLHEPHEGARNSLRRFLTELGWREFARHVLHAYPDTPRVSLNRHFERPGAWALDPEGELLRAWQHGRTGIPLVDAGMRELWETGWMHNRVRMIVASFLTKNLGIHWQQGARWFWDTLVDADLASNTLAWQWVAGCGTDAAPYYRIFNPELQARKFDPDQVYIRRWLGKDAIWPAVVDLKASRNQALKRYQSVIRPTEA